MGIPPVAAIASVSPALSAHVAMASIGSGSGSGSASPLADNNSHKQGLEVDETVTPVAAVNSDAASVHSTPIIQFKLEQTDKDEALDETESAPAPVPFPVRKQARLRHSRSRSASSASTLFRSAATSASTTVLSPQTSSVASLSPPSASVERSHSASRSGSVNAFNQSDDVASSAASAASLRASPGSPDSSVPNSPVAAPSAPIQMLDGSSASFALPEAAATVSSSSNEKKPFKCDMCVSTFSRNHDLKRHVRIHLGIRPYKCEVCSKTFTRMDALHRHTTVRGCKSAVRDGGGASNMDLDSSTNNLDDEDDQEDRSLGDEKSEKRKSH
eukprot:jgi/Hompol1/6834/HPOL_002341-RA